MIETLELQGRHLLQASAGTGKTHSLALLVVRLVLETDLKLPRLVVVTFTEAAALELSGRIAAFLRQARWPEPDTDASLLVLVDRARSTSSDEEVNQRLDLALQTIDQARISTIHGFCSRLLREFAFELRAGLGFERLPSEDGLVRDILADFWRLHIAPLDAALQPRAQTLDPDALHKALAPLLAFPGLSVKGPALDPAVARKASRAWEQLGQLWKRESGPLREFLLAHPERFSAGKRPMNNFEKAWNAAIEELAAPKPEADDALFFGRGHLLTTLKGAYAAQGEAALPPLALVRALDDFAAEFRGVQDAIVPSLTTQAWNYLQEELPVRKAALRVRSDNDLIRQVDLGLKSASSRSVLAIRARFDAVLVDEFQDTDDVQNRIFETLFGGDAGNPVFFVMVGDPKQAIYGFRGGDIRAYLEASARVDLARRHTLSTNYRSQPRLLEALNAVYARVATVHEPFLVPDIVYEPVTAGREAPPALALEGRTLPPLTVWKSPVSTAPDAALVTRRLAAEIRRLREVTGWSLGDFAILVSSHVTARDYRQRLAREGLMALNGKSGSVLETPEADELDLVLGVLAEPSRLAGIRALLLCPLYGWDSARLLAWETDASQVSSLFDGFADRRKQWERRGVAAAVSELLQTLGVWSVPEGDLRHQRRVTNFRQLLELLNLEDLRLRHRPPRTLAVWRDWRQRGGDERFEMAPEAEEGAIPIVTMHHAKGLQWKVVFAVDLHKDGSAPHRKEAPLLRDAKGRRYADFSPDVWPEAEQAALQANAQERLRLAYVTLTRAEELLYVLVRSPGKEDKPGKPEKPDQWLFRGQEPVDRDGLPLVAVEPLEACPPSKRPAVEPPAAGRPLRDRTTLGKPAPRWSVGSYSSLTRDLPHPSLPEASQRGTAEGIFAFPRGTDAGTALHTVLERVDFRKVDAANVKRWLTGGGITEPEHLETGVALVRTLLDAPLLHRDGKDLVLSRLSRDDHAAEVEFYLSAAYPGTKPPLTTEALEPLAPRIGRLAPGQSLAGYLYGLMDLVLQWEGRWYLVDWKSNHLGNAPEDYAQPALQRAMEDNHYLLQAHLYTVAWCRHLATTGPFVYERDFGGVLYLFLRGVDPQNHPGHGIFLLEPRAQDIAALEALL